MHWLRVWLDSQLKFTLHINEKIQRAQNTEIQIKGLIKMYRLVPRLVCWIKLVVIQSIALYGEKL